MSAERTMRGTCPCCFGAHDVDKVTPAEPGGRVHRHGWREVGGRIAGSYGNAWHTGPCLGARFPAFEKSPEGTWYLLTAHIYPHALHTDRVLQALAARPAITVAFDFWVGEMMRAKASGYGMERITERRSRTLEPGDELTVETDNNGTKQHFDYEEELRTEIAATERELARTLAEGAKLYAAADGWKEAALAAKGDKAPAVHFQREGAEIHSCAPFRRSRYGRVAVATSAERADVTCSRCLKNLARDDAERKQKEQEIADAAALVAYLKAQSAPQTSKVIKAALDWDTKRFNKAEYRAGRDCSSDDSRPKKYMTAERYTAWIKEIV